jgi:hypothetical protein
MRRIAVTRLGGVLACLLGTLGCAEIATDEAELGEVHACDDGGSDGECEPARAATTQLSGLVSAFIDDADLTAIVQAHNPLLKTADGCDSAEVFVTSIGRGPGGVDVSPVPGGSDTRISVAALVVSGQVNFRASCTDASASFTMTADAYEFGGVVAPRVADGSITVVVEAVTSALDNPSVAVAGVPGFVEELLRGQLPDRLAGVLGDELATRLPPVIDGFLSGQGIGELAGVISETITGTDFTAVARSLNPVLDTGSGCNSAQTFVTLIGHETSEVGLGQVTGGIDASVSLPLPVVTGTIDFRANCIGGRSDFTLAADAHVVDGAIVPRLEGSTIAVSFEDPTRAFENASLDMTDVPDFVEDVVRGPLTDRMADILGEEIAVQVPPAVNRFYSDFLSR